MVIFNKFLKTKSDPNIHQNALNCTILKKNSRGSMPPNPPSKTTCKLPNLKKKNSRPPPPCQILATPLHVYQFSAKSS